MKGEAMTVQYWSEKVNRVFELATKKYSTFELRRAVCAGDPIPGTDIAALRQYVVGNRDGSGPFRFTLTFTPGWVLMTGDTGFLAASRITDMMEFCRSTLGGDVPNLDYFAEKAPRNLQLKQFDGDYALATVKDWVDSEALTFDCDEDRDEFLSQAGCSNESQWEWDNFIYNEYGHIFDCDYPSSDDWDPQFIWQVAGIRRFLELVP